jgi:replicative DNA helicase
LIEQKLISKILNINKLPEDVESYHFGEFQNIYKFIVDFYYEYKKIPDIETIIQYFPNFIIEESPEKMEFYVERLIDIYNTTIVKKAMMEATDFVEEDLEKTINILQSAIRNTESKKLLDLSIDSLTQIEYYKNAMQSKLPSGYMTKYETYNKLIGGFKPQELHIIAGRAKVGKTMFMLQLAHDFYMDGANIVFISKEMPPHILQERFDSIHSKIPYANIRRKILTDENIESLVADKKEFLARNNKFIFLANDNIERSGTVYGILNKILKYKPDIVFVDSFYLFDDGNKNSDTWQKVGNIAIDLADIARKNNVCVFGSTQLNRQVSTKKNDISYKSLGYSDIIIQVCDSMTALYQNPDLKNGGLLNVAVIADRSGDVGNFDISWNFDSMEFSEVSFDSFDDEEEICDDNT